VTLLVFLAVTTQAVLIRILPRHVLETDDFGYVAATFHVRRAGTVAGLATMSVLQSGLEVWGPFELVRVQILVACLAGIAPHILRRLILRRGDSLLLAIGSGSKRNQQQQQNCVTWRPFFETSFLFQSWTPWAKNHP